jgi:hypothetical protein
MENNKEIEIGYQHIFSLDEIKKETAADIVYFKKERINRLFFFGANFEWLAEEAAEYAWQYNDGWEWIRSGEEFAIFAYDKEFEQTTLLGIYQLRVDFSPDFYAYKQNLLRQE